MNVALSKNVGVIFFLLGKLMRFSGKYLYPIRTAFFMGLLKQFLKIFRMNLSKFYEYCRNKMEFVKNKPKIFTKKREN